MKGVKTRLTTWLKSILVLAAMMATCRAAGGVGEAEEDPSLLGGGRNNLIGGEKAFFTTPMMKRGASHRQNVCDRWDSFRATEGSQLRDGLRGLKLHTLIGNYKSAYFNYDDDTGIDGAYPGLAAMILDELAERAGFTWRESFGVYKDPMEFGASWADLLIWGTDTYDIVIDWWVQSVERMNKGVVFYEEWLDSSLILVSIGQEQETIDEISLWNWLKPYDFQVWIVTIFTIFLSALVYQVLEWYADDRQDRCWWDWWQENTYLSFINFTQAYEYQPKTFSMRLFGISMAVWALVMTATYTANLASLLVDRRIAPPGPQRMDEVAALGKRVCVWWGSIPDKLLEENYPSATRIRKKTLPDLYQGLRDGQCDYLIDSVSSWNKLKAQREYNPDCNMIWVGGDRRIKRVSAGFASKADAGNFCTGFIRDVLNIHLHDLIEDGTIDSLWDREYELSKNIDCDAYLPAIIPTVNGTNNGNYTERRLNSMRNCRNKKQSFTNASVDNIQEHWGSSPQKARRLKAGGKGAAGGAVAVSSSSSSADDDRRLRLDQMIGTFAFHWALMAIALFLATLNAFCRKYNVQWPSLSSSAPLADTEVAKKHVEPSTTNEESSSRDEAVDLRKQVSVLQQHLMHFEQNVMKHQMQLQEQFEQNVMKHQMQLQEQFEQKMMKHQMQLQEQIQLLIAGSSSTGQEIFLHQNQSAQVPRMSASSLESNDPPPPPELDA